jgi:hypothetical protein
MNFSILHFRAALPHDADANGTVTHRLPGTNA